MNACVCFKPPGTDHTAIGQPEMSASCASETTVCLESAIHRTCIRVDKVRTVRRRLAEGTYDIEARLDAVLTKVLADIVARIHGAGNGSCFDARRSYENQSKINPRKCGSDA